MTWLKNTVNRSGILLLLCVLSTGSQAWSGKGHRQIGAWTYQQLSAEAQAYYRHLSTFIDVGGAKNNAPGNALGDMSAFPDAVRKEPLAALFSRFGSTIPADLAQYRKNNTSKWHYHNEVLYSGQCRFENRGELLPVLSALDAALKKPLSSAQEALVMSMLVHLMQDLHQPLHTFTHLNKQCQSDRGGNDRCYRYQPDGACDVNLHQVWDGGFGVFEHQQFSVEGAKATETLVFAPEVWVKDSSRFYGRVYNLEATNYRVVAQGIVRQQVEHAILRLTAYLENHFADKKRQQ